MNTLLLSHKPILFAIYCVFIIQEFSERQQSSKRDKLSKYLASVKCHL